MNSENVAKLKYLQSRINGIYKDDYIVYARQMSTTSALFILSLTTN